MIGKYEKRSFDDGVKVWLSRYRGLTNVLHWHYACEIISVIHGNAKIRIGEHLFSAEGGDSFFCAGEELHYIIGEPESLIDVIIIDENVSKDITDKYTSDYPKIPDTVPVTAFLESITSELNRKEPFYREQVEGYARLLIIEAIRRHKTRKTDSMPDFHKRLIDWINAGFETVTFADAVAYSGYSSAHFSKVFKRISGMTFSDYLNIIKVEHAIGMLRADKGCKITTICGKCGFSTVRNFNRVFKKITGYSPKELPADYILETGLQISQGVDFDPTVQGVRC